MMSEEMAKVYDPVAAEEECYRQWEESGQFRAKEEEANDPFCIVIPPPNVTGQLHMGHALDNTLQDVLIRWHRMRGDNTLWMPGTDHAGIATQIKVEEVLAAEGKTKYDLGRDPFIEKVWEWKQQYGGRIIHQLKKLGASCDWERERFTMDEGCSKAVREVFVSLYEEGLIYQGYRMTNWCPRCNTALSDIEVEHEEKPGNLYFVRYPAEDGGEGLVVATTRPETILGDTAVAVHPEDARYKQLIGKNVVLPLLNRTIPVIADEYVDPAFGTGAVKITPAHDPNDYEMGQRHNLPSLIVMDQTGKMNDQAGAYAGLDRYDCRKQLVADLKGAGYLVKIDEHNHSVGHCQRCSTVVEPVVSKQWFVKVAPLAEPAIAAVRDGRVRFVPERFTKIYLGWMENIRDWCISRQIWWGHRIPAWYCEQCDEISVSRTNLTTCPHCGGAVAQDSDVLDTWFSSALWPFSTLGWPDETAALEKWYPTQVLVTGYDIIFFWVARMMMMGLKFGGDVPFREVFIHGLVRDSEGRKMSKSLGNGIDPLEVIDKYGADTLRFTLVTGNTPGNDMRFYWEKVEASRNFANKLWNASRFVRMNLEGFVPTGEMPREGLTLADRWILSRLAKTIQTAERHLANFELGEAAQLTYEFIWSEYCDWYIELAKPRLYKGTSEEKATAQHILWHVLSRSLLLLHPFMPFITESIWKALPGTTPSLMRNSWPAAGQTNEQAEQLFATLVEAIKAVRNMRAEMNVPPGKKCDAVFVVAEEALRRDMAANGSYICTMAGVEGLEFRDAAAARPEDAVTAVVSGVEIYLPLQGLIDVAKEIERLDKDAQGLVKEIDRIVGKLSNESFVAKAPAAVVDKEREKQRDLQERLEAVNSRIDALKKLGNH